MISFIGKLLQLSRPYKRRLVLGVIMGLLGGLLEPTLMLCVKFAVDVAFPGASMGSFSSTAFSPDNIADLPGFAARLRQPSDELSKYLLNHFSAATREKLAEYTDTNSPPALLKESVTGELNLVVIEPALYNPQRFAGVEISPEARKMLAESQDATNAVQLNMRLLADAYPGQLTVSLGYLDKYPWLRTKFGWVAKWLPAGHSSARAANVTLVILAIPLMMLLRGVVSYLNVYSLQWVAIRAVTDLRTRLFTHLMNMPLAFLNQSSTGELISRVMGDTGALQNAISNSLVVLIKDPATLMGLIALLLWQQPMLTLLSLIIFPLCLIPIIIYAKKVRQASSAVQTESAALSRIMHESFTGTRIIKAYNLELNVVAQFRQATARFIGFYMRGVRAGELPGPLIEFFGAVSVACLFYYILLVSHKHITAGDFLLFVGAVFSMYRPFKSITRLYNQLEQANAASERVFELLESKTDLPEPAHPVPLNAAGAEIKFDSIYFGYDSKPVLENFNLMVKAGQMVALVGATGSGKTTLGNLLLRFYDPVKGAVRIGGIDIRDVITLELRRQIAVVTQETVLFNDTIRHNIELGRPGATAAEIEAASRHAHAHEFIMQKPRGYDSVIGEKGVMLSGGQRQRLAIARAILKNAPILLLDEATSSLDTETERAVQDALDGLMQGRTTICIAHRLSTIQMADLIVVLDQGRIIESGRHEELLRRDGAYRRLYDLSMRTDEEE